MLTDDAGEAVKIAEALRLHCNPQLVAAVLAAEGKYLEITLRKLGSPNLGGARPTQAEGRAVKSSTLQSDHEAYMLAWNLLMEDFRDRLTRGDLFLIGVNVNPIRETSLSVIPGVWAADYEIDFETDAVNVGDRRYVAVRCTRTCPTFDTTASPHSPSAAPPITDESVRDLTDEEVLLLLEEHGRRVIASPDGRLIAPGKVSLLPIVAGKLRHRAEHGEMLDTQVAEAQWLAEWIASKVSLHQAPTLGTIAKVLGTEYKLLKARSNAVIQTLKG